MRDRIPRVAVLLAMAAAGWLPSPSGAGVITTGSTYADYDLAMRDVTALDSVGKLTYSGGLASGTYIGEGWVLTAAHVTSAAPSFTFTIDGVGYSSAQVHTYEGWTGDVKEGGDIGLIQLDDLNLPVPTATLYDGTPTSVLGQTVILSGYGQTGDGDSGATGAGGTLHAGENLLEQTGQRVPFFRDYDPSILFLDFDDPLAGSDGYFWSQDAALDYEYLIAPGDSGGGAFVLIDDHYELVGVNSFLLSVDGETDADYGDMAGLITLAEYADWIAGVTGFDYRVDYLWGDLDRDGQVTFTESALAVANIGLSPAEWVDGDADGNDRVSLDEAQAAVANYHQQVGAAGLTPQIATVPEPELAGLLIAMLVVALIRRPSRA